MPLPILVLQQLSGDSRLNIFTFIQKLNILLINLTIIRSIETKKCQQAFFSDGSSVCDLEIMVLREDNCTKIIQNY